MSNRHLFEQFMHHVPYLPFSLKNTKNQSGSVGFTTLHVQNACRIFCNRFNIAISHLILPKSINSVKCATSVQQWYKSCLKKDCNVDLCEQLEWEKYRLPFLQSNMNSLHMQCKFSKKENTSNILFLSLIFMLYLKVVKSPMEITFGVSTENMPFSPIFRRKEWRVFSLRRLYVFSFKLSLIYIGCDSACDSNWENRHITCTYNLH